MRCIAAFLAGCGGLAVAFGTAAFIMALGIVPRIAALTATKRYILRYESCVMAGMYTGMLLEIHPIEIKLYLPVLVIIGAAGGVFLGCWTVALGEILNMYAILLRGLKIRVGLGLVIWALCLGKTVGIVLFLFVK